MLLKYLERRRIAVLWRLSWPAILEQLLGTLVSYIDTVMVGVLGKVATAAVSINGEFRYESNLNHMDYMKRAMTYLYEGKTINYLSFFEK